MKKLIIITVFSCLLLTGCSRTNDESSIPTVGSTAPSAPTQPTSTPAATIPSSSVPTPTVPSSSAPATETTAPSTPTPQPVQFEVYYPDENYVEFLHTTVTLDDLTAQAVMDELITVGIINSNVTVNDAYLDGTILNLDLHSNFLAQLYTLGSTGERFVIGSIVNTFISAYGAEAVMITVDGDLMDSGHVIYDFPLNFVQ